MVAAVNGPGYLSAHLNLCERPKDNDYSKTVRVVGTQMLETERRYASSGRSLTFGWAIQPS